MMDFKGVCHHAKLASLACSLVFSIFPLLLAGRLPAFPQEASLLWETLVAEEECIPQKVRKKRRQKSVCVGVGVQKDFGVEAQKDLAGDRWGSLR